MDASLAFGPFRLIPGRGLLLDGDRPLRIGARALDILLLLVERAGAVVPHDDIRARAWPGTFVDDANLRVQIAVLRKALGDGQGAARYIVNVPGRGYRFVAPVAAGAPEAAPPAADAPPPPDLPVPLVRLLGRDETIRAIADRLPQRRLLTIVGPGGVGKTSVALAAAHRLADRHGDGARFVDLAPLTDPALAPGALAAALGIALPAGAALPALAERLRGRSPLIVLDNCEHLIEAAAALAETVLAAAPAAAVIATSREPLRAAGEGVIRLPSLALPAAGAGTTAAAALAAPAIQLFVERAIAAVDGFELADADAPVAVEICRQLDGLPLAIELAAATVGRFGLAGLARLLDDRFAILRHGRRTAAPRHQTLRGTLDWSFGLLTADEQAVLRRLSVFAAAFPLDAAVAVAGGDDLSPGAAVEAVAELAAKSFLAVDLAGEAPRYRLLETTRAYAAEKLAAAPEASGIAARHAGFVTARLAGAAAEWGLRPAEWRERHGALVDDARAALRWAFGPDGDPAAGIALTIASGPVWFDAGLIQEHRGHLDRAIAAAAGGTAVTDEQAMRLQIALAAAALHSRGAGRQAVADAAGRALAIAEAIGDTTVQLQALWTLSGERYQSGDYRAAQALAARFGTVAERSGDAAAAVVHRRMMALGNFLVGDFATARAQAEAAVSHAPGSVRAAQISMYEYDNRAAARAHLARILWITGDVDAAREVAAEGVAQAAALDARSRCYVLVFGACPVALWRGDIDQAAAWAAMLAAEAADPALAQWRGWAACYALAVTTLRDPGPAPRETIEIGGRRPGPLQLDMLATVAPALAVPETARRAAAGEAPWCAPELLRAHGERLARHGDAAAAADAIARALALAEAQGARSWALRAATSLARRRRDPAILAPVLARFAEGAGTADHRAAAALLASPGR